ncbi:hypothetical protein LTS18_000471, partial [Coniosporium uncinatum]
MEAESAMRALKELQKTQLSIIRLQVSIGGSEPRNGGKRNSDASTAGGFEDATPASLEAELTHYKVCVPAPFQEHFKKLRFSYIEQVTKEKFLRQLTSDNPTYIEHAENAELEARLVQQKASLQAQKAEVAEMSEELERRGRELAQRYETVELQKTEFASLPDKIEGLEATIEQLRTSHPSPAKTAPHLSLPLPATKALLSEGEAEVAALDAQLASLQARLLAKSRELSKLEAELKPLELQKMGTVAA